MGRYILPELNYPVSDQSKFRVITASRAIASYLKVPYYSLENLAQRIVRSQGIGVASTLQSRRLLQNAVREVVETQSVAGTAQAFLATIKDLFRSGVDLVKLQENSDPRVRQIAKVAIAYQQQLRQVKRIDGSELCWQSAAVNCDRQAYTFYGYFAPSRDELTLINAIAAEDSILLLPTSDFYPQHQTLAWLQSQGWELRTSQSANTFGCQSQQCFQQESTLPPGMKLNIFPSLEAEIRGVLTQVKVLLSQEVAAQDIVLVTREEQMYGETLRDVAWEYGIPVQVAYEIPVAQTRLGAWLKLLLEVVRDNFPFEATAKLLSHPLVKQMPSEMWAQARATHPQGLAAWQELGLDLNLLDFQNIHSREVWVKRLLEILSSWEILENAKAWAREVVAYYRLQSGLTELSRSGQQNLDKQTFSQEIAEILALITIPTQPGRGGVELHCPTSILGTSYSHVFFLGCAEGILPAAIADDPLLDFHSRKQLLQQGFQLTTAVDLAAKETFDFYCLLNVPTQSITFSYPELLERNPTIPSLYLSRLQVKPTPIDLLPLASVEQVRQQYLRQPDLLSELLKSDRHLKLNSQEYNPLLITEIAHALEVESIRESAISPDQYDGVVGIGIDPQQKIFSASQLTQLGQCPFKWFSAKLLRLKELPEAESELDPAVRGNLYHKCLELSLAQIKTAQDLAEFNQTQLAQAFAVAEQDLKLAQLPGWEAQRQEHLNLLALNLATAEFLPPGREVVALETKFTMEWHGLQVRGQVDRIDRTEAGLTVIDYKTSGVTPAGVKDATGKANLDIQLAVYQDAIAQQYPEREIDSAAYYSLTKQKTISRPKKEPEELAAFAARVKTQLQQGHYPVAPDRDRHACRYCDFDLVCRQGDRLSRKNSFKE